MDGGVCLDGASKAEVISLLDYWYVQDAKELEKGWIVFACADVMRTAGPSFMTIAPRRRSTTTGYRSTGHIFPLAAVVKRARLLLSQLR